MRFFPEQELATFPVLLPMSAPIIRAYPREASIAEKLHAMVQLDIRNSRMKDLYDIWLMANTWTFRLESLRNAIALSFERRRSAMPNGVPFALTEEFLTDMSPILQPSGVEFYNSVQNMRLYRIFCICGFRALLSPASNALRRRGR
jgi:hypothetical protein